MKDWIIAIRPRTLPLSLSCIGMGSFLAASAGAFKWSVFLLSALTTIFLQVLSNLANDYGDSVSGVDHAGRQGPARAVQSGAISREEMRKAMILFVILCLASGIGLLWISFGANLRALLFFLGLGLLSILAAITYTVGKKPYGYAGLGDLSVLIFFGLVGVLGSLYLFTQTFSWDDVLPALSCGLFSVAVLNVNNIRDIESDRAAGKFSVPVRLGKEKSVWYHGFLITAGWTAAIVYVLLNFQSAIQFLFLVTLPLFVMNGVNISRRSAKDLDPMLKQMAVATLLFVVAFGVGNLLT